MRGLDIHFEVIYLLPESIFSLYRVFAPGGQVLHSAEVHHKRRQETSTHVSSHFRTELFEHKSGHCLLSLEESADKNVF